MALSLRFHSPFVTESQNSKNFLLDTIRGAKRTLDLCLAECDVEDLFTEISAAKKRGVKTRVIVDQSPSNPIATEVASILQKTGMKPQLDWRGFKNPKAKFAPHYAIIDGHRVFWSTNAWTKSAFLLQDSFSVTVDSLEIAASFTRATDTYWNDSHFVSKEAGAPGFVPEFIPSIEAVTVGPEQRASAYFLPFDGSLTFERAVELVDQAETSVVFFWSSLAQGALLSALEARAKAGVSVIGVLDAHQSKIDHFRHAPHLRKLALSGKIRFMRAFARDGKSFRDLVDAHALCIDGQWVYLGGGCSDRTERNDEIRWKADTAIIVDSIAVADQMKRAIINLLDLAKAGGHSFDRWNWKKDFGRVPDSWVQVATKGKTGSKKVQTPKLAKPVGAKKTAAKKTVAKKATAKKAVKLTKGPKMTKAAKKIKAVSKPAKKSVKKKRAA